MARNLRLADSENFHEITDADLLVGDEVEQAKASGIGQGTKQEIEGERFIPLRHLRNIIYALTDMIKAHSLYTYAETHIYRV